MTSEKSRENGQNPVFLLYFGEILVIWREEKLLSKFRCRHFSTFIPPLTSCKKSEKSCDGKFDNFCDGQRDWWMDGGGFRGPWCGFIKCENIIKEDSWFPCLLCFLKNINIKTRQKMLQFLSPQLVGWFESVHSRSITVFCLTVHLMLHTKTLHIEHPPRFTRVVEVKAEVVQ